MAKQFKDLTDNYDLNETGFNFAFLGRMALVVIASMLISAVLVGIVFLVLNSRPKFFASYAMLQIDPQSSETLDDAQRHKLLLMFGHDAVAKRRLETFVQSIAKVNPEWVQTFESPKQAVLAMRAGLQVYLDEQGRSQLLLQGWEPMNTQAFLEALIIQLQHQPLLPPAPETEASQEAADSSAGQAPAPSADEVSPEDAKAKLAPAPDPNVQLPQDVTVEVTLVDPPIEPYKKFPRVMPWGLILWLLLMPVLPVILVVRNKFFA